MVEESFDCQSFEMLQIEGFSLGFLVNGFTMVEENFEFQSFEMLQNEGCMHIRRIGRRKSRVTPARWTPVDIDNMRQHLKIRLRHYAKNSLACTSAPWKEVACATAHHSRKYIRVLENLDHSSENMMYE